MSKVKNVSVKKKNGTLKPEKKALNAKQKALSDKLEQSADAQQVQVSPKLEVDQMTNAQVKAYYEGNLRGKDVADMTDAEMQIATLYGEMVKATRDQAEVMGVKAEIEQVRRKAKVQIEIQGTAAYMQTVFNNNIRAINQQEKIEPIRISIAHGNDVLEIDETIVANTFLSIHSQKAQQYRKVVQDLMQIIRDTAQQETNRVAMPDGKDYRTHIADLSWVDVRDKKAATNQ